MTLRLLFFEQVSILSNFEFVAEQLNGFKDSPVALNHVDPFQHLNT